MIVRSLFGFMLMFRNERVYTSLEGSKHFGEEIKAEINKLEGRRTRRAACVCAFLPSHGQPYSSTLMQTVVDSMVTGISLT